jgi:hypothetical protein
LRIRTPILQEWNDSARDARSKDLDFKDTEALDLFL